MLSRTGLDLRDGGHWTQSDVWASGDGRILRSLRISWRLLKWFLKHVCFEHANVIIMFRGESLLALSDAK
jgi:hypothetical protein